MADLMEVARLVALCRERAEGYGALRRSSLTSIALDRAADMLASLGMGTDSLRTALGPFAVAGDMNAVSTRLPPEADLTCFTLGSSARRGDLVRRRS